METKIKNLYIHIPICKSFCSYCDFPKVLPEAFESGRYFENVIGQIKDKKENLKLETIYIGGGTPSLLTETEISNLFSGLAEHILLKRLKEVTFEMNPEDVSIEKIALLQKVGVTRISLGVQTFSDNILKRVNRKHTAEHIFNAIKIIGKSKIMNYSIDMIYNLPSQTEDEILYDLKMIEKYKPNHISWYSLITKESTELENHEIDCDIEAKYMEKIQFELERVGYNKYEISNYAISEEYESIHNKGYWESNNWLGVGYGASSFLENKIVKNHNILYENKYTIEKLSEEDVYYQVVIMGLRQSRGLDLTNPLHFKAFTYYKKVFDIEILNGNIILDAERVYVDPKMLMLLDNILLKF